jgi:hypothetical protein
MNFRELVDNKRGMKKILPVPYISQYSDSFEQDWKNRSCGIACVAMLLGYYNLEDLNPMILINEGIAIGGHCQGGWFHESLVRIIRNHGINSYAQEFRSVEISMKDKLFKPSPLETKLVDDGLIKIIQEIDKKQPVIVSVKPNFNGNDTNHLLIVIGYDFSDQKGNLIIHDPNGKNSKKTLNEFSVNLSEFQKFWRKFAIFSYR